MRPVHRWLRPALLAASGSLLISLSVAPIGLWWLALVAWAPLTLVGAQADLARRAGDGRAVLRAVTVACLVGFGRWLWLEQWIRDVSDAGWPALAACMAGFDGLYVWLVSRSESRAAQARWPLAARTAVLLVGCEWFRGRVFLEGYPWFMPAQPLVEWPLLAQAACVVGAAGMGVLPAAVAGALADVALARAGRAALRRCVGGAIAATCVLLGCLVFGAARLADGPAIEAARTLDLLAVQTNVTQSNKDAPDRARQDEQVRRLLQLTRQGLDAARAEGRRVDLVVWPETVVPGFGFEPDAILLQKQRGLWPADRYVEPIQQLASSGPPILLGSGSFVGLRVDGDRYAWRQQFNSAYLVRGGATPERVDKILLTPFGETMPYISKWKWLEQQLLELGARGMRFDLQAGDVPRLLTVPAGDGMARIGVPICFEDTVARAVRSIATTGEGADALVNLSNDGWLGDFDAARQHHEQAARWRTIEMGCALARVANTGTSGAFDALGRRIDPGLPCRAEGVAVFRLPVDAVLTPFRRMGDVASWTMFLGSIVMTVRLRRFRGAALIGVAALSLGAPACDSSKEGRLPTWSSREQSVTPDGSAKLSPGAKPRAAIPVSMAGDPGRNAAQLLDEASRSSDPMIRAIALEAMEPDPTLLEPAVRRGLGDPNAGVRYVAAVVGSKAKLPGLAPLVEPLLLDPNDSVRAAAILALHRAGRKVDPSPLGRMILSQSPEVRGNAAMVIGDMGNRTALPMLNEALLAPMPRALPAQVRVVDLQIGEAMAKLGDTSQLEPIHAALFSRSDQGECIGLACQIVGTLRDQSAMPMLQRLIDADGTDTRPVEIRLVAAVAVMHIMRPGPTALADLGLLGSLDMRPEVRGISAKLLGFFASTEADAALSRLLRDRDPAVQVAAAASILKLAAAKPPVEAPR